MLLGDRGMEDLGGRPVFDGDAVVSAWDVFVFALAFEKCIGCGRMRIKCARMDREPNYGVKN